MPLLSMAAQMRSTSVSTCCSSLKQGSTIDACGGSAPWSDVKVLTTGEDTRLRGVLAGLADAVARQRDRGGHPHRVVDEPGAGGRRGELVGLLGGQQVHDLARRVPVRG